MSTNLSRKKTSMPVEWETLLEKNKYWKTLRVTAWALRFSEQSLGERTEYKGTYGAIDKVEMGNARNHWIKETSRLDR